MECTSCVHFVDRKTLKGKKKQSICSIKEKYDFEVCKNYDAKTWQYKQTCKYDALKYVDFAISKCQAILDVLFDVRFFIVNQKDDNEKNDNQNY